MKNLMRKRSFIIALCLLAAFALWTELVGVVDVRPIGPSGTSVGFAGLNRWVHRHTGVSLSLYVLTDWLGLIPMAFAAGFAILGLLQWMRRGHILKVDPDILALGVFYILVLAAYLFFEAQAVNFRPVLIEGRLEVSYPSSTTLLVLCVMPTAAMQLRTRIPNRRLSRCICAAILLFTAFMVAGRLLSGVHWFTDIVGGILLSAGLVCLYASVI